MFEAAELGRTLSKKEFERSLPQLRARLVQAEFALKPARISVVINDMVAHTSREFAPWTLVAGNDKRFARIQILKTLRAHLEMAL
jgi:hypothetical protein